MFVGTSILYLISDLEVIGHNCQGQGSHGQDQRILKKGRWAQNNVKLLHCNFEPCDYNTYFVFNETFYEQKQAAAIGFPVSPIIAKIS